jgi:hypothetical protein
MKKVLVLILVISLIMPIKAADSFNVTVIPDKPYYEAGETARVTVIVANKTNSDLENVEVKLFPKKPFSIEDTEYSLGDIGHGWRSFPKTAIFEIEIDEDADSGEYTLEGKIKSKKFSQEFDFKIRVISEALISVENVEYPENLISGDDFELSFDLNNIGGSKIEWIKLNLISEVFMPRRDDLEQIYKNIEPKKTTRVTFSLGTGKKTLPGTYPLTVNITYKDEFGNIFNEQKTLAVTIEKMKNAVIDITDVKTERLVPGDRFELSLRLKNMGSGEIQWIKVGINPLVNSIPILTPNNDDLEKLYNDFQADSEIVVTFDLSVNEDLDSGNYPVTLILAYLDELGILANETHIIGLEIRGVPRIVIQGVDSDPKIPFKGGEVTLSVNLENIGTGNAKIVKVGFSSTLGTFMSYVGGIKKGDSNVAVFNTVISETENEKCEIKILVEYEDEIGNKKMLEDKYIITLKERKTYGGALIGVFALAIIGIIGWWYKKRRDLKKIMK